MLKERDEQETIPATSDFTYWNRSWQSAGGIPSESYSSLSEGIDSFTGSDGRFRPCDHVRTRHATYKTEESYPVLAPGWTYISSVGSHGWRFGTHAGAHYVHQQGFGDPIHAGLSDDEWSDLDAEAVQIMTPTANIEGVSTLNFLYELKDFRRLTSRFMVKFNSIRNDISSGSARYRWVRNRLKRRARRELSKEKFQADLKKEFTLWQLSNRYLSYSFAWAPLVSDILKIRKTLVNIQQALHELKIRQAIPQTRHYHRYLDGYSADDVGKWTDWKYGSLDALTIRTASGGGKISRAEYQRRTSYIVPPVYRATMRYTYAMPGLQKEDAALRLYLDALGIRWDPSIIWNAVPFTFILDWVADVGKYLRQFSVDNLQTQLFIEDFCSSVKVHEACEHRFRIRKTYPSPETTKEISIGYSDRLSYRRRTSIPGLFTSVSTSALSLRQASLGAALLVARMPKQYRAE